MAGGRVSLAAGLPLVCLLCCLAVQGVLASSSNNTTNTTTTNSNNTAIPAAGGQNATEEHGSGSQSGEESEKRKKSHYGSIHVLAFEFDAVQEPLIFTVVVLLAGLSKIGFHHADFLSSRIPESCMLIILGTVFGAIIHFSGISDDLPELFSPHRFFLFLLPPIILEAAFSLYDRTFSENIGTVLLFAVVGTIISCFLIGLTLYGLMMVGAMGPIMEMNLVQILIFSALIVAVDPVAVLAVFTEIGVNDVLYFIVFGESLLNDGVTVVLYKVMQSLALMETIEVGQIFLGIAKFFVVCFGGLFIGIIAGIITSLLTRLTMHVGVAQPLVIYTMAYLGFLMSELFEVSGIISIIGCGLVQRHYAFSNVNHKSRTTVKYFTKVLASASEIIIFLFLGLELVSDEHEWHTGFVLWTILLCTVYRFLITFGLACLVNHFDTMRVRLIGYDEMFMIAFGGLRGAVAFSLAALLEEEELPMKRIFVTTTLTVVMFTVFIQGITIRPLVNLLSITLAPEKNQSMYCELNNHVVDHLMAGVEDVVGKRGRNHIREKIEQIDADYFQKWLMNEPEPTDTGLQDFYTKIIIKEHYKNLKLCGAKNVAEPTNMPHIDTQMYLSHIGKDQDAHSLIEDAASIAEHEQEPPPETPVLRRRKTTRKSQVSSDLHGLRNLLKQQRTTRMNLHSGYDRNLTTDISDGDLQTEIVKKSAHNRRLERLMSTVAHGPMGLQRCVSWRDRDAQIAMKRTDTPEKLANKRAVSLDLGSGAVAYSPSRSPADPRSPTASNLGSVFEDSEEDLSGAVENRPALVHAPGGVDQPELQPLMSDVDPPESRPLLSNVDPCTISVEVDPPSDDSDSDPDNPSVKRRKTLKRQDDLKPSSGPDDV